MKDKYFMNLAMDQAVKAEQSGEVPVGAVLVSCDDNVIGYGHNQSIALCDPSGHAEMIALRTGGKTIKNYRLLNTTLYVTMEPCIMCMAAIIHARVKRVVFGVEDKKWGGAISLYRMASDDRLNHTVEITSGVYCQETGNMIKNFFKNKRSRTCQI